MSNHTLTTQGAEIVILQKNIRELQSQLADAHKRILELNKAGKAANEELTKERQLLLELEAKLSATQFETTDLIEKQIEDWPEVLDSKPTQRFKPRKTTWSEPEDIKPGEWD